MGCRRLGTKANTQTSQGSKNANSFFWHCSAFRCCPKNQRYVEHKPHANAGALCLHKKITVPLAVKKRRGIREHPVLLISQALTLFVAECPLTVDRVACTVNDHWSSGKRERLVAFITLRESPTGGRRELYH